MTPTIAARSPTASARASTSLYVRRQVSPDQARRVADLRDGRDRVRPRESAALPNRELASHLLGYVGVDNVGLGGIEGTYDSLIRGKAGTILVQTDARRHAFSRVERPPTTGASLELTIDQYLQYVAERELRAGVESSGASAGSAVIMDPAHRRDSGAGELPFVQPEHLPRGAPETHGAIGRCRTTTSPDRRSRS